MLIQSMHSQFIYSGMMTMRLLYKFGRMTLSAESGLVLFFGDFNFRQEIAVWQKLLNFMKHTPPYVSCDIGRSIHI